jgi:antitoxin component of MazEF toxin-antitoxin module
MKVKLRQIGSSVGCLIPQEEIEKLGAKIGDVIELQPMKDPFWEKVAKFSKEERRLAMADEDFGQNDLSEWENL